MKPGNEMDKCFTLKLVLNLPIQVYNSFQMQPGNVMDKCFTWLGVRVDKH